MKHFTSTYDRNQYTIAAAEVGLRAMIDEDGSVWYANASGTGATKWTPVKMKHILLSLNDFFEVDSSGDVAAIAVASGNGGNLAADTTPIKRGDSAESLELSWATGNVDPIQAQIGLPDDIDDGQDFYVDLDVNSGTTDAATMAVETGWNGGTLVVDSASDAATKSATTHTITATVAAADVPASPKRLTLALTPPTHATNAIQLSRVGLRYYPKAP